jgi:hypothetical protein
MCTGMSGLPGEVAAYDRLPKCGESIDQLCRALADPRERREFYLNEDAVCLRYGLDRTARQAVKYRDYLRLIQLGAHVAQLDQLASLSGLTTLQAMKKRGGVLASLLLG